MKLRTLLPLLATALLLLPPTAMAGKVSDDPGYMNLDFITIPANATEIQDIDLSDILLSIAANAEDSGDTSLAKALGMIHSVRVKAFSLGEDDVDKAEKAVHKVMDKLEKDDWSRLIYLKDDKETVTVSTKSVDGKMVGLMVVVFDPTDEALFVNVAGDLNLSTLFKLAQEFDVEDLDAILADMPQMGSDSAPAPEADQEQ